MESRVCISVIITGGKSKPPLVEGFFFTKDWKILVVLREMPKWDETMTTVG